MKAVYVNSKNEEIESNDVPLTKPQLCELLNETYNTIRYWCDQFSNYLNADMSQRNVKFNKADVELFKTIQLLLRENQFSIKQVKEYLDENAEKIKENKIIEVDKNSNKLINENIEEIIKKEVQATVKECMNEFLSNIQNQLVEAFIKQQNLLEEKQKELIKIQTDKITEKVASKIYMNQKEIRSDLSNINDKLNKIEMEATKKENETIANLKERLNTRENNIKALKLNNEKSWWSKLFKK